MKLGFSRYKLRSSTSGDDPFFPVGLLPSPLGLDQERNNPPDKQLHIAAPHGIPHIRYIYRER